jgi:hypothetical protein
MKWILQLQSEKINQHKHLIIKNINYITEKDILIEVTKKMHWVVWEFYNGKNKGFHIHHINENSWDNRIENLEEIKSSNHLQEHMKNRMINNLNGL